MRYALPSLLVTTTVAFLSCANTSSKPKVILCHKAENDIGTKCI